MGATEADDVARRRRDVAIAGHAGDAATARAGLVDPSPSVRSTALGALERLGVLADDVLADALRDDDPGVRRRAAEVAATHPGVDLVPALADPDDRVVEVAAWACGEHESARDEVVEALLALGSGAPEPLVRESAVAALGAIGDRRAIDVIVAATSDKPAIRRRAVLALAPFLDDHEHAERVAAAVDACRSDRDWQVRQAAEDLDRTL